MSVNALTPSKLGSILAAGLILGAISIPFAQATAQESGTAIITINIDVLESLGPEQPDAGRSTAQALKSGSLLAPPQAKPESRLTGQFAAQSPEPLAEDAEDVEEAADKPAKSKKRKAQEVTAETPSTESQAPTEVAAALEKPEAAATPLKEAADKPAKTKKRKAEKVTAEAPSAESQATVTPEVAEEAPAALSLMSSAEASETPAPSIPVAPSESEAIAPTVPEVPAPPGQTQIAAASPTETIDLDARLLFAEGSAELSAEDKQKLLALADQLQRDPEIRIQLLAFAAGDDDTPNEARPLSMSRALVVRGFLVDQGITASRVQVRALGQSSEDGPPDRVDIKPQGG